MNEKIDKIRELAGEFRRLNNQINISPLLTPLFEEVEVNQELDIFLTQYSYALQPEPLTLKIMSKLLPYSNPKKIESSFQGAIDRDWLIESSKGEYLPTEKTTAFVEKLYFQLVDQVSDYLPIDAKDVERFSSLTAKIIESALMSDAFQDNDTLKIERKFFDENASDYYKAAMNSSDLFVLRDIAHIHAWSTLDLQGYEAEAFSFIWEGEIKTAAEILEKRPNRGYSEKEYVEAFNRLLERGWLAENDGEYEVTKEGKNIRDAIEESTNKNFNSAFTSFSETEVNELVTLFEKLIAVLKPEVETAEEN